MARNLFFIFIVTLKEYARVKNALSQSICLPDPGVCLGYQEQKRTNRNNPWNPVHKLSLVFEFADAVFLHSLLEHQVPGARITTVTYPLCPPHLLYAVLLLASLSIWSSSITGINSCSVFSLPNSSAVLQTSILQCSQLSFPPKWRVSDYLGFHCKGLDLLCTVLL